MHSVLLAARHAKPDIQIVKLGLVAATDRRASATGLVDPRAAAHGAEFLHFVISVFTPFPDVAVHIADAERVRGVTSHYGRSPQVLAQVGRAERVISIDVR